MLYASLKRTIPDGFLTVYDYATSRYKFVILVGWSGGDKGMTGALSVSKATWETNRPDAMSCE